MTALAVPNLWLPSPTRPPRPRACVVCGRPIRSGWNALRRWARRLIDPLALFNTGGRLLDSQGRILLATDGKEHIDDGGGNACCCGGGCPTCDKCLASYVVTLDFPGIGAGGIECCPPGDPVTFHSVVRRDPLSGVCQWVCNPAFGDPNPDNCITCLPNWYGVVLQCETVGKTDPCVVGTTRFWSVTPALAGAAIFKFGVYSTGTCPPTGVYPAVCGTNTLCDGPITCTVS